MNEKLVVWICVGGPGSGKSTFANLLVEGDPRIVRVCPDDNRRAISGDSNDQTVSYPAFCMAKDQMKNASLSHQFFPCFQDLKRTFPYIP